MSRIIGIDYGIKKCGIAVTDPMQIIVNPLKTVKTSSLLNFLKTYIGEENVSKCVFGLPSHLDGNPTYVVEHIHNFVTHLKKSFPKLEVDFQDENYTSKEAKEIILQSGLSKKQRQDKSRLDKISAVLILQRYLKHI
ncbi:MAG: Holliday junction resolvase RuvX [Saprospiraceae bacterium]|nr:Holliday junction resolvase RuvX [Saprospiraceae bacterium]